MQTMWLGSRELPRNTDPSLLQRQRRTCTLGTGHGSTTPSLLISKFDFFTPICILIAILLNSLSKTTKDQNFKQTLRKFGSTNPQRMFQPDMKKQVGLNVIRNNRGTFSPDPKMSGSDGFYSSFPMRNHKVDSGYDRQKAPDYFAQGDNGGMSHNRYQNKGNDLLRRKRQSNMRSIGYGISTSVKPKALHLTYQDY